MRSLKTFGLVLATLVAVPACAQSVALRDLLLAEGSARVRLVGYGLVTGLSGTGDRVTGNFGSRQTVQSIVNLLRRFDVEVPAELLRTRNVAAVLVTADVSAYLRRGGRFDVTVSSIGDAQSLTGGVLWMTPLVAAGGAAQASAQGPLLLNGSQSSRMAFRGATSGRVPDGGVIEAELERPQAQTTNQLLLREPNIETATRIAAVVDSAFDKKGTAKVVDPGSIVFAPADTANGFAAALARVQALRIEPTVRARLVVDARDGTIVAGSDLRVGPAVVSHDGITVVIGAAGDSASAGSTAVRAPAGSFVSDVAKALRASRATATQTAAIFTALRDAGAISAEVIVR